MEKLVKLFLTFINLPRLLPSLCVLVFFYKKCKGDIAVNKEHHSCNLPSVISFMYLMTFDKWFRNLFYYRIGHVKYLVSFFMPPFPSFFIGTYAKIGEGVKLVHPYATYINAVSVGKNFTIRNNVTIGDSGGKPVIGNNVIINVNSVVVGNITIGNNVTIGASSVVMKDIPSNCVVMGNPAYILKKDGVRVNLML